LKKEKPFLPKNAQPVVQGVPVGIENTAGIATDATMTEADGAPDQPLSDVRDEQAPPMPVYHYKLSH
jgi:hypothetical protein